VLPESTPKPLARSSARLQVVARAENSPKIPLPPIRQAILDAASDGRDELEIAANLKIPVDTVRRVLFGFAMIADRQRATMRAGLPRWLRDTLAEVEASVWEDMSDGFPPPANSQRPKERTRLHLVAGARKAA
jgi:hypothetical protein